MWPWEVNLIYKKSKLVVDFKLDVNLDLLIQEYKNLNSQKNQVLHPDIYHNGGWYGILLRAQSGELVKRFSGADGDYQWTTESDLTPYTKSICESIGKNLKRVRYLTLMPGYKVHWHYDNDESFSSNYIRCHIPLITNKGAVIWIGNQKIHMKLGQLIACDFGFPHKLMNFGKTPRTHLVFDVEKKEISSKFGIDFNNLAHENQKSKEISQLLYDILFNKLFQIKFYYRVLKNKINNGWRFKK